jgi:copper oxidase (laccase) domain-containing protein
VGDEVYDQFQAEGFPMEKIARRYPAKLPSFGGIEGGSKWHIDLPLCNRLQLEEAGVCQIELSGICTWQQSDDYFSARKLGVNSGRILTGVVLR